MVEFAEEQGGQGSEVSAAKKRGIARRVFGIFSRKSRKEEDEREKQAEKEAEDARVLVHVSCGIEEIGRYFRREDRAQLLAQVDRKLVALSQRANPFYRGVIQDYRVLIQGLNDKSKQEDVADRLTQLVARRTVIQRQADAVSDHLNWFEADQMLMPSGKFDNFFDSLELFERRIREKRRDPISKYLDSLEKEFR